MNSNDIRSAYLKFFEEKAHSVIASSPLVPRNDPTLLFTTAGMVQFKNYYLGIETPPNRRLVSCQKSFRTTDIESVGDTKHLTFFEMLGNFSIGDYFKKEAILWSWEFVIDRLKLDPQRIWITVYTDDNEALEIWHRQVGVPLNRIMRFGAKDNFWGPAGSSGPCGPCSELHYDFGEKYGCGKINCNPSCSCGRFVEMWNLVFTQFNQDENNIRTPLPRPNIDTGMGLERITAAVEGKTTVYETDIFAPLLQKLAVTAGKKYGENEDTDNALRVIVEHSRATSFLMADGVIPTNDGRGYVLRRLIRRTALFGKKLGLEKPFLADTCSASIEHMQNVYPELNKSKELILKIATAEESRFHETLNTGLAILDELIEGAGQVKKIIPGDQVFKLYDTYGFPVELTREIVARAGISVDMDGFEREMGKQKERARSAHKFDNARDHDKIEMRPDLKVTEFIGHHKLHNKSKILDILSNNRSVDSVKAGQEAGIILDVTPFYGEKGGQVGDTGILSNNNGTMEVTNTFHIADYIVHQGKIESGSFKVGDEVSAEVTAQRRRNIASNHTATHLLQYALRQVLGKHVQQRGSQVGPEEFRFDFSHLTAMTVEEIKRVQHIVNENIRDNLIVNTDLMNFKEAVTEGATALFDEKYGDVVRVVKIGSPLISSELCGGTHVTATGQIGFFQILTESSIGAGLRRIVAVTGEGAEIYVEQNLGNLTRIAQSLGTSPASAYIKLETLMSELDEDRKKISNLQKELSLKGAGDMQRKTETINGVSVLAVQVEATRVDTLREIADTLKGKLGSAIIVLAAVIDDKPSFIAMVTPDLIQKGYHAGEIVKKVAGIAGGGGGGKPGMAQAGGKDKSKIKEALQEVKTFIK